jgi:hypothetical protein
LLALPLPLPLPLPLAVVAVVGRWRCIPALAGLFGDGNWTGDAPACLPEAEAEAVDGRAAAAAAAGLPRWLV